MMRRALSRIATDSTVFIYFSGHGAKEADDAFWLTQDAELDALAASAVSNRDVQTFLARIPSQRVIVMLDCCYAAATVKGDKTAMADFSGVLRQFTGKGRAFLMAAGSGEEAIEAKDLKHSVFTHHLVQGLAGKADSDQDGVIVLTELASYLDRHVADEARIRGGIQRPTVEFQEVREPSRFRLTIDADRLSRNLRDTAEAKAMREQRLAKLRDLSLSEKLSVEQHHLGRRLIETGADQLDEFDRRRLGEFVAVLDGRLAPESLQRALEMIETPQQRAARLAREAAVKAEAERQATIDKLWSTAQQHDSKEHGRTALTALDELLKLDPNHQAGSRLSAKIRGYYVPSKIHDSITNSVAMKLTYIPAGEFVRENHRVRISKAFLMGTTEVTQGQWRAVMGTSPSHFKGDNLPVEMVSWHDAVEFCRLLSQKDGKEYRLPTEAEWEYACRAGTTTEYSSGNGLEALKRVGWYRDNSGGKIQPVGQKQPNAWGLYDMHGNVWEWCSDWYGSYPNGDVTDPPGPGTGSSRVLRGGSWISGPVFLRAGSRLNDSPYGPGSSFGFRVLCVSAVLPGPPE